VIYEGRPGGYDESKARTPRRPRPAPGRCGEWRRRVPGLLGRRRADRRDGQDHGPQTHHPGAGQPEPEIRPELAKAVRPDCIIATGRSDYPNQVNNVLCFPYIFRGALDCGATKITEAMKLACVREIADLAKAEISDEVATAYAGQDLTFGPDYLIPKPFDSRLILKIAPAVARPPRTPAWPRDPSPTWRPTPKA
jgi:malate dehydrogenase (oxaloacetate-decarboxylating)(NADP+)